MLEFFQQIFKVAWVPFSMRIPIAQGVVITPWQIALGGAVIGLILRYLFNKGASEQ